MTKRSSRAKRASKHTTPEIVPVVVPPTETTDDLLARVREDVMGTAAMRGHTFAGDVPQAGSTEPAIGPNPDGLSHQVRSSHARERKET